MQVTRIPPDVTDRFERNFDLLVSSAEKFCNCPVLHSANWKAQLTLARQPKPRQQHVLYSCVCHPTVCIAHVMLVGSGGDNRLFQLHRIDPAPGDTAAVQDGSWWMVDGQIFVALPASACESVVVEALGRQGFDWQSAPQKLRRMLAEAALAMCWQAQPDSGPASWPTDLRAELSKYRIVDLDELELVE